MNHDKPRNVLILYAILLLFSGCSHQASHTDSSRSDVTSNLPFQEAAPVTNDEIQVSVVAETETIAGTEAITKAEEKEGTQQTDESLFTCETITEDLHEYDFTICFAGDINLAENWCTTNYLDASPNGIYDCIDGELMGYMKNADLMCLNNEFSYGTTGSPLPDKSYCFQADPSRVQILKDLGVDLVSLANNHVYDYGEEGILETFQTLEDAEIPYFGAGRTLSDAKKPYYVEIDNKKIAFVGASRAEKNKKTPQATENSPGILRCYDTSYVLESIKEARANADFVIVFVHWGTEYSTILEDVQITDGHDFIDAGADAVIGAHSHCLQGMEFYEDKPIVYSLGNYWFNEKTLSTMLINLSFSGNDESSEMTLSIVPALQKDCQTTHVSDPLEIEQFYQDMTDISIHITINEQGMVQNKDEE